MNIEAILTQTVEQPERKNNALAALRRERLPGRPRKFSTLAEGLVEEMRRWRAEIELFTTQIASASPVVA